MGSPWYSVVANHRYQEEFQYYGSHLDEREKIIEDGYECDFRDHKHPKYDMNKRYLEEQSDLCAVLLNLAYIPDTVVLAVDFGEAGWSWQF